MSEMMQAVILLVLWAYCLGTHIADYVATVQALAHGQVEGNPIGKWFFSKIGMPATTFLGAVVATIIFVIWTVLSPWYGMFYAGILAAFQTIFVMPKTIKVLKQYGLK